MTMNDILREVHRYLTRRNDYLIWAGHAGWILAGIESSPDLDLYLKSAAAMAAVAADLERDGWVRTVERNSDQTIITTYARSGTTVDLCYSPGAAVLFPAAQIVEVEGIPLRFVSTEGLFLTKLGQALAPDRLLGKQARDLMVLAVLRPRIKPNLLAKLIGRTPARFWQEGYL